MKFRLILLYFCFSIIIAKAQKLTVFQDQDKKGYRDDFGYIVIPAKYESAESFINGYAKVAMRDPNYRQNGNIDLQYGIIDKTGKEIIPLKYSYLAVEFSEGLMAAELNKKWGFINTKNETVVPFKYDYAKNFSGGLAAVNLNKKWGFINATNKLTIPFQYDEVREFKEARCAVQLYDKWGFINEAGTLVIPYKYDDVSYSGFSGGLTGVEQYDKWAVINTSGKVLTAFKYDDVESSYDNRSLSIIKVGTITSSKWLYGVVDAAGTEIIPVKYQGITIYDYNVIVAKTGDKSGVINSKHKTVLPFEYLGIYMFKEYAPKGVLYKTGEENNTRVFSVEGDKINIWKYEYVQDESEGLRAAMYKNKWGFFNAAGADAIPFIYDSVANFLGGYAFVKLNKKVGYIDKTGKQVIPVKYDVIYNYSENMAPVTSNGKWGFINAKFEETIPLKYEAVRDFTNGYAAVQLNKKMGAIDQQGQVVVPIKYDDVDSFSDGMFAVVLNNKIGFVNAAGIEVIACSYEQMVSRFVNGKAKVVKDGKTITIDKTGKVL